MAALDGRGLRLDVAPGVGNWVIFLNHRRAPTDDLACDRRWPTASRMPVVANTLLGKGTLAHGAVPTSVWGHDPEPSRYVEDLDKAAACWCRPVTPMGWN